MYLDFSGLMSLCEQRIMSRGYNFNIFCQTLRTTFLLLLFQPNRDYSFLILEFKGELSLSFALC